MKEIELTQGKVALVDDKDYEYLSQWKWRAMKKQNTWYAVRTTYNPTRVILMHREIMNAPNDKQVDHINRNGCDNRRKNLRLCTNQQNGANRGAQKNNTSGYKGVYWHKTKSKWNAKIKVSGKKIHLGYYQSVKDAAKAYDKAADEFFGEFAYLNFPKGEKL